VTDGLGDGSKGAISVPVLVYVLIFLTNHVLYNNETIHDAPVTLRKKSPYHSNRKRTPKQNYMYTG